MTTDLVQTIQPVYDGPRFPDAPHLGQQRIYVLPNGYGLSLIRGSGTYAGPETWELAVVRVASLVLPDPESDRSWAQVGVEDFNLCYHTPVTGDVLGWQSEDEVREHLAVLATLPAEHDCNGRFPDEPEEPDYIDGEVISVVTFEGEIEA